MPTEYFEQRERALLGQRYEQLYAALQQTAERGVTVSALRTTPEQFAQRADFPLEPSPFCKAAFVVHQPDFKPGRHPYHHAGVFYSQEPSASSAAPLLGVQKPVIKAHGASNAEAIDNAIGQARQVAESGIIGQIQENVHLMQIQAE